MNDESANLLPRLNCPDPASKSKFGQTRIAVLIPNTLKGTFVRETGKTRSERRTMTAKLHEELAALCSHFFSGELSEEEWALLQIHLAYCDSCHRDFIKQNHIKAAEETSQRWSIQNWD